MAAPRQYTIGGVTHASEDLFWTRPPLGGGNRNGGGGGNKKRDQGIQKVAILSKNDDF